MCGACASLEEKGKAFIVLVGNLMEGGYLEELSVNGRIILKLSQKNRMRGCGVD
jgi:hypothetical protein